MSKYTEWYPAAIRPVRVGVYEVMPMGGYRCFSYWNGDYWFPVERNIEEAYSSHKISMISFYQNNIWRGLNEKY